jgi:hypothetical protein
MRQKSPRMSTERKEELQQPKCGPKWNLQGSRQNGFWTRNWKTAEKVALATPISTGRFRLRDAGCQNLSCLRCGVFEWSSTHFLAADI